MKAYLDNAATTALRPEAITAMQDALMHTYGNPSSTHSYGRAAKSEIEKTRKTIAKTLNTTTSEIVFTSGGTEADNMALLTSVRDLGVRHIITSKIEHHAVLRMLAHLQETQNITVSYVALDENAAVDYQDLEAQLAQQNQKTLVSLMHINNEIGTITDIALVGELCRRYQAYFHSDTVQSIGHFAIDLQKVHIHFLTAAAHKFHGPKGIGFLYVNKACFIKPYIFGGQQEKGLRAGTESLHNIIGLKIAFEKAYANLEIEKKQIQGIKSYFIKRLKEQIPGVVFNGNSDNTTTNTYTLVNVNIPTTPEKANMLLFALDLKGVACSKGSACQSGSPLASHVLEHIASKAVLKRASLRFSFSYTTTKQEIDHAITALKQSM